MHHRLLVLSLLVACGPKVAPVVPAVAPPDADAIVARLTAQRQAVSTLRAESLMDYWFGDNRIRGTMLVMGTPGAKVRFNALSPAGDAPMADMACDGRGFTLLDYHNNCVLTGPCNEDSIAQLLRVALTPDDFYALALGQLPARNGQGRPQVAWNDDRSRLRLVQAVEGGELRAELGLTDAAIEVYKVELTHATGGLVWAAEHTAFTTVQDDTGKPVRLPGKSRLRAPGERADLLVEWQARVLNKPLEDAKFVMTVPANLPVCGATPPTK